jgi:tubby-related protein 1
LYDDGVSPKNERDIERIRREHGIIEYETNVLGSKGPRRMKVLLPLVNSDGQQVLFKSVDVTIYTDNRYSLKTTLHP